MKLVNRWFPFLALLLSLLLFSACSDSLQKPTGLEDELVGDIELVQDSANSEDDHTLLENTEIKDQAIDDKEDNDDTEAVITEEESTSSVTAKDESGEKTTNKNTKRSANHSIKTNKQTSSSSKNNDKTINKHSTSSKKDTSKKQSSNTSSEKNNSNPSNNNDTKQESKKDTKQEPKKDTVTISIVISSSEVPLGATEIEIEPGDMVLDVFYRATRQYNIHQSVRGTGSSAYIEGIANVYEFDRGPGSGWMYRINGVFPDRGVGAVHVENGDRIELLYTTNLGKDLNANLQPYRR